METATKCDCPRRNMDACECEACALARLVRRLSDTVNELRIERDKLRATVAAYESKAGVRS